MMHLCIIQEQAGASPLDAPGQEDDQRTDISESY